MASDTRTTSKQNKTSVSDETILKVSKEIIIKFIEVGRVTPASFEDTFANIHSTVKKTVDK